MGTAQVDWLSVGMSPDRMLPTCRRRGRRVTVESFERRHGEPIGFFVPVTAKDRSAGRRVLGLLEAAVEEVLTTSSVTENELVDALGRGRCHR